jgi:tRNA A37 threonylcarbamoyladenosine synthetase subunit TsaC/SUA5/YrdC
MEHTMILKEEIGEYEIVPSYNGGNLQWKQELSYAERLGNEFKGKATITFETTQGSRTVQTTVWSLTENYIVLKGGITVPLNSITEVHF